MAYTGKSELQRARRLRRNQTEAESRLWRALRGRRMQAHKFVRQMPVGPYVADFACRLARVIVEVDGVTHSSDAEVARDRRREAYLREQGYGVIRVQNEDIMRNMDDVLDMIIARLEGR